MRVVTARESLLETFGTERERERERGGSRGRVSDRLDCRNFSLVLGSGREEHLETLLGCTASPCLLLTRSPGFLPLQRGPGASLPVPNKGEFL